MRAFLADVDREAGIAGRRRDRLIAGKEARRRARFESRA
jgi:hypothetical protein